jgi:glycosyltransferase involved in cell wall biosynthesis
VIIAFDTWVLKSSHRHSGIYNYAKSLLGEFRALAPASDNVSMRFFFTHGYSDRALDFTPSPNMEVVNTRFLHFHRLWQLGGVTAVAALTRADLIFSPSTHTCPFGPIPVITTIHDVTPVLSPSFGSLANLLEKVRIKNAARFSVKCITDSECSKKDLLDTYGLSPEKVTVVYLGYDREIFNTSQPDIYRQKLLFVRYGIERPYIFHHGTLQPRKNLLRLIQACRSLWRNRTESAFQLVLAGPQGWNCQPVLEAVAGNDVAGKIVLTGPLPDQDLALLLKGSEVCVIPSLYEGFCLPMVEAMACGTPTIASNTSCMPEVSGRVLHYFDPLSTEEMATVIADVLDNSALRRRLSEVGIKRAEEFSWERCAKETMAVLSSTRPQRHGHSRNGNGKGQLAFQ